jgi:beta-lactamase superfamily II metal-dependent hydrolase
MLHYGKEKFLLMGDATIDVEVSLRQKYTDLRADFLKIGHHGSKYSTSEAFLDAVQPTYAAISVGAKNTYGHPAWRVIRLLEKLGIIAYRTDRNGNITASTDGDSLQIQVEKLP